MDFVVLLLLVIFTVVPLSLIGFIVSLFFARKTMVPMFIFAGIIHFIAIVSVVTAFVY
jgi:hypothetical protein